MGILVEAQKHGLTFLLQATWAGLAEQYFLGPHMENCSYRILQCMGLCGTRSNYRVYLSKDITGFGIVLPGYSQNR